MDKNKALGPLSELHWNSFWDLTSPEDAACALREFYGTAAAEAAAHCATAAKGDRRDNDYLFWIATFDMLNDSK